jgi:hypothetical protein
MDNLFINPRARKYEMKKANNESAEAQYAANLTKIA